MTKYTFGEKLSFIRRALILCAAMLVILASIPAQADVTANLEHKYPGGASYKETKTLPGSNAETMQLDLADWSRESHNDSVYPLSDAKIVSIQALYEVRYYKDSISEDTYLSSDFGHQPLGAPLPPDDYTFRTVSDFAELNPINYQGEPMITGGGTVAENPASNVVNVVFMYEAPVRTSYTVRHFYSETKGKIMPDQTFGTYNFPGAYRVYVGQTVSADEAIEQAQDEINYYTYNTLGNRSYSYKLVAAETSPDISITLGADAAQNIIDIYYDKLVAYKIIHMQQTGVKVWASITIVDSFDYAGSYYSADNYHLDYPNHVMAGRYSPASGEMYLVDNNPINNNRMHIYYDWKPGYTGTRAAGAATFAAAQAVSFPVTLYDNNIYEMEFTYASPDESNPGAIDDGCMGDCGSGCNALPFITLLGIFSIPPIVVIRKKRK